jgi:hypothetical protein
MLGFDIWIENSLEEIGEIYVPSSYIYLCSENEMW